MTDKSTVLDTNPWDTADESPAPKAIRLMREPAVAIARSCVSPFAVSMIVVYDATGVRRQAGIHAQKINIIFEEFLRGEPIEIDKLKEVLGHTPPQVVGGVVLGLIVAFVVKGIMG